MRHLLRGTASAVNDALLRAYVGLELFASMEPVRLRAALVSLVMAAGVLFPAVATADTAQVVGGIGAVVLPMVVGESTRRKVTPAH